MLCCQLLIYSNILKEGAYVRVVATPRMWEGAGESPRDRESLVGHYGLVVELDEITELCLVQFMQPGKLCQRWIEWKCLELESLSDRPALPISKHIFDQCS